MYRHDWETVTSAFWVKYPNTDQPHVTQIETCNHEVDKERGQLRMNRLVCCEYTMPAWARKVFGKPLTGLAVEEAICDLPNKTLTLHGRNQTFSNIFRVEETCQYTPHPENPNWTLYTQKSSYSIFGFPGLSGMLEKAAVSSASEKSSIGLRAMQKIIARLEAFKWQDRRDLWVGQLNSLKELARRTVGEVDDQLEAAKHRFLKFDRITGEFKQATTGIVGVGLSSLALCEDSSRTFGTCSTGSSQDAREGLLRNANAMQKGSGIEEAE